MSEPYSTTLQSVRDGICRWFGGPYDPATRSYRTPQVDGLGVVRRARPKSDDEVDYYLGQPAAGALIGSQMLVHIGSGVESRSAIAGAYGGLKFLQSSVVLHVFLRSNAEFAEDAQDAFYDLLDALKDRLREDRCMGTGGWENGGFQVGEGGAPWIRWHMEPAETSAEMTQGYLAVEFQADYYEEG